jgi:elongation factor G
MRSFCVLGPSQSGKSTIVQKLASLDGGATQHEQAGMIGLTRFAFMGEDWCAIDLPGGPEFTSLAGAALMASDAAILVLPPDPDAAVLAAPYLRAIEAADTPCLIFINKVDAPQGRIRDVVAALQDYSAHLIVLRQIPIREGASVVGAVDLISERAWRYREGAPSTLVEIPPDLIDREQQARAELLEHMADYDDALLEQLIEDRTPASGALFAIASRETAEHKLVPALIGAASHANGMMRLMKALRHEAPEVGALAARLGAPEAMAVGFHAIMRRHVGKCTLIRVLRDGVRVGSPLGGGNLGNLGGIGGATLPAALPAGMVALAAKSDQLNAGQLFTAGAAAAAPGWSRGHAPSYARMIVTADDRNEVRLSGALARLQEIDPNAIVTQDEGTGHTLLLLQGPMHLRRILTQLADDFGIEVQDHPPSSSYRETISRQVEQAYRHKKQTGGAGQFADVLLILRPLPRGEGFRFDETVKGGTVPRSYFPAVEDGARDAMAAGPLGFPVIDVGVTLTDGKFHAVDSSEFAFRTAARSGVAEALAAAEPVLLQPIHRIDIHVPSVFSGALVPAISGMKGHVLGFERNAGVPGWDIFRALLPASANDELIRVLAAATQGTAWHETRFDHFEEVYGKEAEKISRDRAQAHAHT